MLVGVKCLPPQNQNYFCMSISYRFDSKLGPNLKSRDSGDTKFFD